MKDVSKPIFLVMYIVSMAVSYIYRYLDKIDSADLLSVQVLCLIGIWGTIKK